jgi:hypothetical protein
MLQILAVDLVTAAGGEEKKVRLEGCVQVKHSLLQSLFFPEVGFMLSEGGGLHLRGTVPPHPEDVVDVIYATFRAVDKDSRAFDGS